MIEHLAVVVSAALVGPRFLTIRVTDAGIGIDAEDIPKMFETFVRGGDAPPGTETGTGLGLRLVKRLVELNGGSIDIEGGPAHGRRARTPSALRCQAGIRSA